MRLVKVGSKGEIERFHILDPRYQLNGLQSLKSNGLKLNGSERGRHCMSTKVIVIRVKAKVVRPQKLAENKSQACHATHVFLGHFARRYRK